MLDITKEIDKKNSPIVTKVSIADTLRAIKVGSVAQYHAAQLGVYTSVLVTAKRLTEKGEGKWLVTPYDNGAYYTVERFQ